MDNNKNTCVWQIINCAKSNNFITTILQSAIRQQSFCYVNNGYFDCQFKYEWGRRKFMCISMTHSDSKLDICIHTFISLKKAKRDRPDGRLARRATWKTIGECKPLRRNQYTDLLYQTHKHSSPALSYRHTHRHTRRRLCEPGHAVVRFVAMEQVHTGTINRCRR